jgi:vancomycin resistance protein YoaR
MVVDHMADIYSGAPKVKRKKHTAIGIAIAAFIVLCAGGGFFGKQLYSEYQHLQQVGAVIDVDTFYPGIVVQGVDLGGKTMDEAKAEIKKLEPGLRGKYNIKVQYSNENWNITEDDLTFTFDTDSVLKEAYAYARSGDREERYNQVMALQTEPKKYQIANTMSYEGVDAKLKEMTKKIAYDPVDATVVSFNTATSTFQYADGKAGLAVDQNKLYTEVVAIINGAKTGTVDLPTTVVPFNKTIAEVSSHLQKLGTFSTVSTNGANGTHNMMRALASVNGTCVPAGGTFSFNKVVGNSNQANGYLEAGAILNGKLIQAYGGGICQSSTTLYGAALRSNMKIVERSNHTIQSSYCPIGQDATVSYPELDFKFMNPTEYPVYIVTTTKGKVLTATFYGYQSPDYDTIEITSQKTETIPAPTTPKYTIDKTLAKGVVRLDGKARAGSKATAQRVFYKNGVIVKTENLASSYYHALPTFYSIGPGTVVTGTATPSSSASSASSKPSSSSAPKPSSSSKPSTPSSNPASSQSSSSSSPSSSPSSSTSSDDGSLNNNEIIPD